MESRTGRSKVLPSNWPFFVRSFAVLALAGVLVSGQSLGCKPQTLREPQQRLQGSTMGTTYTIRYFPKRQAEILPNMQQLIDEELKRVNQQMSTYLKDSEISSFNASRSTDWFPVSADTASVVALSLQISTISNGAFDVTVAPLVNLWGFGPHKSKEAIPSDADIEATRATVGFKKLSVQLNPPALRKSMPELQVDLSAIAKGHGVDRVAELFRKNNISDFFIEIGGEIYADGTRLDGQPWQVGIEAPLVNTQSIQTVVGLSGAAMATSGDYRNFFEANDQKFSHTIDPSSGFPVTHQLASASVVSENCALADAIATCMMVLGPEKGLRLAETENWAVLLMQRNEGSISSTYSNAFSSAFPIVCRQLAVAK
jgi:thiamine biosynthesis lipoprotein